MDEKAFAVVTVPNAHVSSRTNQYLPVIYLPQAAGIAVSAVFLALLLRWTDRNRPLTDPQIAVAVVCTALLFLCKVVYAAEALLVLCLPDRVLAVVNVHDNLAYAAAHPGSLTVLLLWNVLLAIPRVTRQSFLVAPLTAGAGTACAGTAAVIVLVVLILVCVPLPITWNDLSVMHVPSSMQGIQGRYLLPLLPLLLCVWRYGHPHRARLDRLLTRWNGVEHYHRRDRRRSPKPSHMRTGSSLSQEASDVSEAASRTCPITLPTSEKPDGGSCPGQRLPGA